MIDNRYYAMISIIILNYKSKGLVKNCIKSIYCNTKEIDYEIIVVDNNSGDDIGKMLKKRFPDVNFIQSENNLGFATGNNIGIKKAKGKYIAIINPDIVLMENSFKKMRDFMEKNQHIGIIGPQLVNPNGNIQYTRCRFPEFMTPVYRRTLLKKIKFIKNKINHYLTRDCDYNKTTKTDWVFGAFLFTKRDALENIGLFDERFFLGFEDTDLCKRFWDNEYEVWYFPKTKIIHYPHRFSKKGIFNKAIRIHIASWLKYFWKLRVNKFDINS